MSVWCKNCGMGKDCVGYTELKSHHCCNYIPTRRDGSVNFDLEVEK